MRWSVVLEEDDGLQDVTVLDKLLTTTNGWSETLDDTSSKEMIR